ncbi:hypothetical protein ES332_D09G243100v1 [Gossypium tomentosum]|uniref:Uncharacterized protein n=1 Tax=Gossypium tomentosum TaxID=34277 RepID=A0A5D2JM68_GOSTO|nr:hypothetical protein ES332_D09G243100v1 [Gossypium tomentosum]
MNRHTSKQTKLRIKTRYTREASDWRRIQETEDKVWEILWIKNKKFSEYNKAKSRVNETIVACGYGECVVKDSAMCTSCFTDHGLGGFEILMIIMIT